jgi:hypothetical protein
MKPQLRFVLCSDDPELSPNDVSRHGPQPWSVHLQLLVGPEGGPGEESFQLTVCNPAHLSFALEQQRGTILSGRHHLIVEQFVWDDIDAFLRETLAAIEGKDWNEVASRVSRLAWWEFEDYEPH